MIKENDEPEESSEVGENKKFTTTLFQDVNDEPGCLSIIIPEDVMDLMGVRVGDVVDVSYDEQKKVIVVSRLNGPTKNNNK